MRTHVLRSLATSILLAASAAGQVVINEVLYDPLGPDAGLERIELTYLGPGGQSLAGWSLAVCYPGTLVDNRTYWTFPPGKSVISGQVVTIHYLEDGTDTANDWYTGTSGAGFICVTPPKPMHDAIGSVALFNTTDCLLFTQGANLIDFVQWGSPTHHQVQAGVAGQWTFGTWVPDVDEGHSIAYEGEGDGLEHWFEDASPTIGFPNGSPGTPVLNPYGLGCAGTSGAPVLDSIGGPPAFGNQSFQLRIQGALPGAPAVVAMSTASDAFPLLGCTILIDVDFLVLDLGPKTASASGVALFPLPVPDDPTLLGGGFYFQGAVVDAGAPSGLVAFSSALEAIL